MPPLRRTEHTRGTPVDSRRGTGRGRGRAQAHTVTPQRSSPGERPVTHRASHNSTRPARNSQEYSTGRRQSYADCYVPEPPDVHAEAEAAANESLQSPLEFSQEIDLEDIIAEIGHESQDHHEDDGSAEAYGCHPYRERTPSSRTLSGTPTNRMRRPPQPVDNERPPAVFVRGGGSSAGSGLAEDTPLGGMPMDNRPFIRPSGKTNFSPSSIVRRIGLECIAPCFEEGWTTMETCPIEAQEKWFQIFETIAKWDSNDTTEIKAIFRRKVSKMLSDGWSNMRSKRTKGPKFLKPSIKAAASKKFDICPKLKIRSAQNKQNYLGQVSRRGPSKHTCGPRPIEFHHLVLETELKRQVLPSDVYRRTKMKGDTFMEHRGAEYLENLLNAEALLRKDHPSSPTLPEAKLVQATVDVCGTASGTGYPRVLGALATRVPDSKYSVNTSTQSVNQRHNTAPPEDLVTQVADHVHGMIAPQMSQQMSDFAAQMREQMHQMQELILSKLAPTRPSPQNEDDECEDDDR